MYTNLFILLKSSDQQKCIFDKRALHIQIKKIEFCGFEPATFFTKVALLTELQMPGTSDRGALISFWQLLFIKYVMICNCRYAYVYYKYKYMRVN